MASLRTRPGIQPAGRGGRCVGGKAGRSPDCWDFRLAVGGAGGGGASISISPEMVEGSAVTQARSLLLLLLLLLDMESSRIGGGNEVQELYCMDDIPPKL